MTELENDEINTMILNAQTYFGHELHQWYREIIKYGKYDKCKTTSELIAELARDLAEHVSYIEEVENEKNNYIAGLIHGAFLSGVIKDD